MRAVGLVGGTTEGSFNLVQCEAGCFLFIHRKKAAAGFRKELEIALFHAARFAVIHPVRAIGHFAEIEPIMPRHRLNTFRDGRRQVGDVGENGRAIAKHPKIYFLIVVFNIKRLVPGR